MERRHALPIKERIKHFLQRTRRFLTSSVDVTPKTEYTSGPPRKAKEIGASLEIVGFEELSNSIPTSVSSATLRKAADLMDKEEPQKN